jgi:glycosyl hydrolase family 59
MRITATIAAACLLAAGAVGTAMLPALARPVPARSSPAAALPTTSIVVDGNGGGRQFGGIGAVLGGGGTARYLEDYPATQRSAILRYLFKPGYGASLQLLKLEIGGDGATAAGSEPSIEHTRGVINCNAGYEFAIAKQAVALDPSLKLYGLQWGAPGWVGNSGSLFTSADISYLLDWLGCAKKLGLSVSYLGGWDETDNGTHATWYHSLRLALDAAGYRGVKIVAADGIKDEQWEYIPDPDVAILGAHNNCGYPTGKKGPLTKCFGNWAALHSGKPMWGSELGGMSAGAQQGCKLPCATGADRAFTREYIDARVSAEMLWPAIVSMPAAVLPYEDRGLVTAVQPWSGHFQVNALTWAVAQFTQFAWPPSKVNPQGWHYLDSASGYLQGNRADGSYVTLVRGERDQWSSVIETTAGVTSAQRARFTVKGGAGLATKTVHVWASDFNFTTGGPAHWFVRQPDITPVGGKFTLTVKPGYVYSLTTTTGQGKGSAGSPPPVPMKLPFSDGLSAGTGGQPSMLAAQDGAFELAPCSSPDGSTTCAEQTASGRPVLWSPGTLPRHPYAITGGDWSTYTVSVDAMLPQPGSAGLIARFHAVSPAHGMFDGYLFDVNTDGTFTLALSNGGAAAYRVGGQRVVTPPRLTVLASGTLPARPGRVPFGTGTWHRLSLSVSGATITAAVDGRRVASLSDATFADGSPGIETGGWYPAYFSNLTVTSP